MLERVRTAPSPAAAACLHFAIKFVQESSKERDRVLSYAKQLAKTLGVSEPAAAIIPFPASSEEHALELQAKLASNGLDVRAIRPPTVPPGGSRLRIVCHAWNRKEEMDELERNGLVLNPTKEDETRFDEAVAEIYHRLSQGEQGASNPDTSQTPEFN